MNTVFDIGENRHVRILIHSLKREDFVILGASYALFKKGIDKPEMGGLCEIDGHVIDTIISPRERGEYILKIIYRITDETLIENVGVLVL